jgi:SAM-dependent methyltransferase
MKEPVQGAAALRFLKAAHYNMVFSRRVRVLAESLAAHIPRDATVLDIGCGDGMISSRIAAYIPEIQIRGVEIAPRPTCRIECMPFDGIHIPLPDRSMDLCMFVDVLHHTDSIRSMLSEASRVSRRFVLLKDHLWGSQFDFFTLKFMDWVGNRPHGVVLPYNYQSRAAWDQLFNLSGLEPVSWTDRIPLYPFPFDRVFGRRLHFITLLVKVS